MTTKYMEKFLLITTASLATMAITLPCTLIYISIPIETTGIIYGIIIIEAILISCIITMILFWQKTKYRKRHLKIQKNTDSSEFIYKYHDVRRKHYEQEQLLNIKKFEAVSEYVRLTLSPYMSEEDISIVCNNIKSWIDNENTELLPVSTDGRLASIDLRHFAWNVGERFNWKGQKRALFIKILFPLELRDIEVSTIRRNLRQSGNCIIELDIPEKGDYRFSFQHT